MTLNPPIAAVLAGLSVGGRPEPVEGLGARRPLMRFAKADGFRAGLTCGADGQLRIAEPG